MHPTPPWKQPTQPRLAKRQDLLKPVAEINLNSLTHRKRDIRRLTKEGRQSVKATCAMLLARCHVGLRVYDLQLSTKQASKSKPKKRERSKNRGGGP